MQKQYCVLDLADESGYLLTECGAQYPLDLDPDFLGFKYCPWCGKEIYYDNGI